MKKIIKAVSETVNRFGTNDPAEICAGMGIHVFVSDLPEITDGVYYCIEGHRIILINQRLSEINARYATAHELAHAILHSDCNYEFIITSTLFLPQRFEREADDFSCELLLYNYENEPRDGSELTALRISFERQVPLPLAERWLEKRREACRSKEIS